MAQYGARVKPWTACADPGRIGFVGVPHLAVEHFLS
jgi:hypothetical protein